MKVLLRNPKRELEVDGPVRVARAPRPPRPEPRVGARDRRRHARARRRPAATTPTPSRSGPSSPEAPREVHRVQGAGGHRRPAPQRQLLRRALPAAVPRPGGARRSRTSTCSRRDDRALVAVSGGKDSLAVWDILLELGYQADGLYLGLGIGDYSDRVGGDGARLRVVAGPHACTRSTCPRSTASTSRRAPRRPDACRARRAASPSATCSTRPPAPAATTSSSPGHNLDDEAAVLFGNVLHWQTDYLGRQLPVLPARHGFPRKVKPLVRLGEREMAAYCVLRGIDYIVEECPMAAGNKHLGYKEALNAIEATSPGSKHDFYFGFLARASERFTPDGRGRAGAAAGVRPLRRADHRRGVRVLPPRRAGDRGARRARPEGGRSMSRAFAAGEQVLLIDTKKRRYLLTLDGGQGVPLALGRRRPRRGDRLRRGHRVPVEPRDDLHRHPSDARRLRAEDAARRAGDLSEGPRPDPAARRHLPGRAGARVRRRIGCAVDDAAAGRRRRSSGYELREDFAARAAKNVAAFLGDPRRPLPRRAPRLLRGHRRDRPRPRRPRPPRAVAGGEARRTGAAPGWDPAGLHAPDHPGRPAPGDARRVRFGMAETIEVLQRGWHIEGQSVRPDHRMVAHTGLPHPRPARWAARPEHARPAPRRLCAVRRRDRGLPPRVPRPCRRRGSGWPLGVVVGALVLAADAARRSTTRARAQLLFVTVGHPRSAWRSSVRPSACSSARGSHATLPGATRALGRPSGRRRRRAWSACSSAIWVLLPLMADVPGWFAAPGAHARRSPRCVDDRFPEPPDTVDTLRRLVGEDQFRRVFATCSSGRPTSGPRRPRPTSRSRWSTRSSRRP